MWARGHSFREISDLHRRAAIALGVEREWAYVPTRFADCPACGEKVKPSVAVCKHCGAILDAEKAAKRHFCVCRRAPVRRRTRLRHSSARRLLSSTHLRGRHDVGARPLVPRNFRPASARSHSARRRTRMGLRAHPFRGLPCLRRKGEAQRRSLQTLRRNPRRRKSRQARPRCQHQQQRRESRYASAIPTNATVGARHAVPGKRTWRGRAIHPRFQ